MASGILGSDLGMFFPLIFNLTAIHTNIALCFSWSQILSSTKLPVFTDFYRLNERPKIDSFLKARRSNMSVNFEVGGIINPIDQGDSELCWLATTATLL
jgi:hypothetical protein